MVKSLLDGLFIALSRDADRDELCRLLYTLAENVEQNFSYEEELMAASGYPERDKHMRQHIGLIDVLEVLIQNCASGHENLSVLSVRFLDTWLAHHIKTDDAKLGRYLQRQSPASARNRQTNNGRHNSSLLREQTEAGR